MSADPVIVYIAETSTSHFDWLGVGATADEARDALMHAWAEHCAQIPEADPAHLRRDEINVRHGALGTGWRDYDAFPPR